MYGDREFADLMMNNYKGNPKRLQEIFESVVDNESCINQRKLIKSRQKISIQDWVEKWKQ
jgi:hypothetical protein